MDEKQFEKEYRREKQQSAPDLWNRIEPNLKEHPERKRKFRPYGIAAAAAVILVAVLPAVKNGLKTSPAASARMECTQAMETTAAAAGEKEEAGGIMIENAMPAEETQAAVQESELEISEDYVQYVGKYHLEEAGDRGVPYDLQLIITKIEDNKVWGAVTLAHNQAEGSESGETEEKLEGEEIEAESLYISLEDEKIQEFGKKAPARLKFYFTEKNGKPAFSVEGFEGTNEEGDGYRGTLVQEETYGSGK